MLKTNWEDFGSEGVGNEVFNKTTREIDEMAHNIYWRIIGIYHNEIRELRNRLSQIPILIADFDDTLTARPDKPNNQANRSIFAVLEKLERLPHKKGDLQTFYESWDKVNTFYSRALRGLTKDELFAIYEEVIQEDNPQKAIRLNPNFLDICRIIHQATGAVKIPLFILSLNSHEFIKMWFESKREELTNLQREEGIEIILVAIMANQIIYDHEDRVAGVIQHVTNDNKALYIPEGAIVLADIRETRTLLNRECNVVNIEEICYNSRIVNVLIACNKMIFSRDRIISRFPELSSDIDETLEFAKALKLKHEERTLYQHSLGGEGTLTSELRMDIEKFMDRYSLLMKKIQTLLPQEERRE